MLVGASGRVMRVFACGIGVVGSGQRIVGTGVAILAQRSRRFLRKKATAIQNIPIVNVTNPPQKIATKSTNAT